MTGFSRRSVLGGSLAFAGASACPIGSVADAKHVASARSFVDAVGVCTHPSWRETAWGSTDWESAFLDTGVKSTRGKIGSGPIARAAVGDLRKLFARGVKVCVTVPEVRAGRFDLTATKASLDFLVAEVGAENICGIESANEFNNPRRGSADWAAELRRFQFWLHETVRSTAAFDGIPLIGPSIWRRLIEDYRQLGNLAPSVDRACLHYYTGGRRPTWTALPSRGVAGVKGVERSLRQSVADARVVAPSKPLWATEFGYALQGPGAQGPGFVSQMAAAKYLIRGLFDLFGEGVEKIFIYTLLEDARQSPGRYHGLMDGALNARLAYHGLRNLMRLFVDDGRQAPAVPLDVAVTNDTLSTKNWLFAKSDGTSLLVLYHDVDSYDLRRGRDLDVIGIPLRVDFGAAVRKAEVFTPTLSAHVRETWRAVRSIALPVGDHVTVVKITP